MFKKKKFSENYIMHMMHSFNIYIYLVVYFFEFAVLSSMLKNNTISLFEYVITVQFYTCDMLFSVNLNIIQFGLI